MSLPVKIGNEWIYTCDHCQRRGRWSSEWSWFGNLLDREDGRFEHIFFSCCDECRTLSKKEIASLLRGLAKKGPASIYEDLKEANHEIEHLREEKERLEEELSRLRRAAKNAAYSIYCHFNHHTEEKRPDPSEALRQVKRSLDMALKGSQEES